MTRGSIIWGKDELTRAPYALGGAQRDDLRQPALRSGCLHPVARSRVEENDLASLSRSSMQSGSNTSPGLFASVVAGSHGEESTPLSFLTARAKLKLAKFAQAVLDVFAASFWLFYVALWIVVILGLIPFALFCLFLIQF